MYIAADQGQTTPGDKILMSTETSLKSDFIQFFFHDFIHEYSPRAGDDNLLGMKYDVNRNILSLCRVLGDAGFSVPGRLNWTPDA